MAKPNALAAPSTTALEATGPSELREAFLGMVAAMWENRCVLPGNLELLDPELKLRLPAVLLQCLLECLLEATVEREHAAVTQSCTARRATAAAGAGVHAVVPAMVA